MLIGMFESKSSSLPAPFTAGNPVPCWYGPWVSNRGPYVGVVSVFPLGIDVNVFTPPVQPEAGHDGQTGRDQSSDATTVITNVAYIPVPVPITTWHSLQPSHITIDGWFESRRIWCRSSVSWVAVAAGECPPCAYLKGEQHTEISCGQDVTDYSAPMSRAHHAVERNRIAKRARCN